VLSAAGIGTEEDEMESIMLILSVAAMLAAASINESTIMNNHTLVFPRKSGLRERSYNGLV
jgi:hypothetical protein